MRCVICGSILPDGQASQCGLNGCGAPICPGAFGDECRSVHRKQIHQEEEVAQATSIMGFVKGVKDKLRATEARAAVAEGHVIHWKAVNHATDINWRARFGALVKWMRAAHPEQLKEATASGLCSEKDILPEA